MENQRGQAIIILLLIMVVGLTIGLSVVSRSILNVKLSTQSEESSRAFTAAEAGVEVALEASSGTDFSSTEANLQYECTKNIQGASDSYVFYNVAKDRAAQLYFSDPGNIENKSYIGSKVRLMWGTYSPSFAPSPTTPALELTLLYKTKTDNSYHVAKFTLDPDAARAGSNHFCFPPGNCGDQPRISNFTINGTSQIDDVKFQFGSDVDVSSFNTDPNFLIFGRFRLLYNSEPTTIGVKSVPPPVAIFPSQGSVIDCLGTRDSGVSRRIKVYENYPSVPEIFDYVLFNGNPGSGLGH